jgi:hypothetical protein
MVLFMALVAALILLIVRNGQKLVLFMVALEVPLFRLLLASLGLWSLHSLTK